MNSIPNSSDFKSHYSNQIKGYLALSQSHMNIASLLLDDSLTNACLIIGHMSVKAMLKAVYLKVNDQGVFADLRHISFEELLSYAREHNVIDLEAELFLNTVFFLSSHVSMLLVPFLEKNHVIIVMNRIEELLNTMSEKVGV